MSHTFLLLLVFFGLVWNIHARNTEDGNSAQNAKEGKNISSRRGVTGVPKFIVRSVTKVVKNAFRTMKDMLMRFEKYTVTVIGDTLGFLASSDNTTLTRKPRSPQLDDSEQSQRKGGGVISTLSKLFMSPFKLAFGSVKWVPVAVFNQSAKLGVAVAGDVAKSPIVKSLVQKTVAAGEKLAEESWDFAKVNVFPKLDKWVTSARKSHSLPDSVMTFLTEIQTLYHIYKFLGLA